MPRGFDVVDGRQGVGPATFGVLVAGEPRERDIAPLLEGYVEPVTLKFRWRAGGKYGGADFEVPVRPPNAVEIIMLVNRALAEGKLEFGFRPKAGPSTPFGGG